MKTLKDFEAVYTIYEHGIPIRQLTGNIWAWQETYRQVFGPGSHADKLERVWDDQTIAIYDAVDWKEPKCCKFCKETVKEVNEKLANKS